MREFAWMSRQGGVSCSRSFLSLGRGWFFCLQDSSGRANPCGHPGNIRHSHFWRVALVNHLFISTTGITGRAYSCLFPLIFQHGN